MNIFNETWKTFLPPKKERRSKAIKNALSFAWEVFLHLALIGMGWISLIIVLSL